MGSDNENSLWFRPVIINVAGTLVAVAAVSSFTLVLGLWSDARVMVARNDAMVARLESIESSLSSLKQWQDTERRFTADEGRGLIDRVANLELQVQAIGIIKRRAPQQ